MTPLRFEEMYQAEWAELEALLDRAIGRKRIPKKDDVNGGAAAGHAVTAPVAATTRVEAGPVPGAHLAALYRRACEHLALARARAYPAYLVDRLERMTADGHQLIYHRREFRLTRLREMVAVDFPVAVRAQMPYVMAATVTFLLPTLILGALVYSRPELILSVVSTETAASFEEMYSPTAESIGRTRTASTDWIMFGYYIRNNITVAFQCFAAGLFAGLGTLFFLGYNGAFSGAIAGYLTERGLSSTFYAFIATHSSFELTAIVLAGAAGLRMGHSLLAPGRLTRLDSLVEATQGSAILLYGVTAMLVVAAAIEAFWSSANWLPAAVKYSAAALCWTSVFGYFAFQGRRAG